MNQIKKNVIIVNNHFTKDQKDILAEYFYADVYVSEPMQVYNKQNKSLSWRDNLKKQGIKV